jgi:virulence factor Mce-like protein
MQPRRDSVSLFDNPVLIGAIVVLLLVVGVYVSYNANRGLPFVPTYRVHVNVPNAAKLNPGDAVKVAGARIGQVLQEQAIPPSGSSPAFTQLTLALGVREHLPIDSTFEILPLSILGAKYLNVTLGQSKVNMPAGGTFTLAHYPVQPVELDQAFSAFNPTAQKGIQATLQGVGDGFAGRGADLNYIFTALYQLLPAGINVSRVFLSPKTDLTGFINGLWRFTTALAPVSPAFGRFWVDAATVFTAWAQADQAFGETLDLAPQVEATGTSALTAITPVLREAAEFSQEIAPGTKLVASASQNVANTFAAGVPVFKATPSVVPALEGLNSALASIFPPSTNELTYALNGLQATFASLGTTLTAINPSQTTCNVMGILLRNVGSVVSFGSSSGSTVDSNVLVNDSPPSPPNQAGLPAPTSSPSPGLHINPYPLESSTVCQAGRETFTPGQTVIGNPPGQSNVGTNVDRTTIPPDAAARAQSAGLLTPPPGARP